MQRAREDWQYAFAARFAAHRDASWPLHLYDSARGIGHLVCAVSWSGRTWAMLVDAHELGAVHRGPVAAQRLERILATWEPVLEIVLHASRGQIQWLYSGAPGYFCDVSSSTGRAVLTPVTGGLAQLYARDQALISWLMLTVSEACSPRASSRLSEWWRLIRHRAVSD